MSHLIWEIYLKWEIFTKSCGTQFIGFCDSLALSLINKIRIDVIYFDFTKAFDSVKHDIILYKLKHQFHIDGFLLAFLVHYLKDRSQSVVLGNNISSTKIVTLGVPQGSILGPTLFVLFFNDISSGLNDKYSYVCSLKKFQMSKLYIATSTMI